ncbi:MAG TPA: DUF885 domain-containing protein [Terriglobales bacterium]|nr:DUF885 domain-containing protein [Terriglobales bacterium]
MRARVCLVTLITFLVSVPLTAAPDQSDKKAQLIQLFADQWEYELRESPELATSIGDYRYNDRWSDGSLAHVQQQKQDLQNWLAKFQSINSTGLDEQATLSLQLMVRNLKERIEGIELKTYLMPVDQFNGVQLELAQFPALVPTDSTKHYEDYISRLHKIPVVIDQAIEVLQEGRKNKLMPPRFLLEKAVEQCRKIAQATADTNAFAQPVKEFPTSIAESDQKRLREAVLAAIDHDVRPAYQKLENYLAKQYAPYGRTEPGVWALPNGDALYRYDIRLLTTTNMEPEQIHQLGLSEVTRIEGEQLVIAKKLGFEDLKAFRASLKSNPRTRAKSPDEILAKYRGYIDQMRPELPKLFGLLPKTPVEVRPMQEFRAKEAAAADYQPGTPDGSRPGIVWVNTSDFDHRDMLSAESTSYHEGIPGHHMQISIAQSLTDLPAFRRYGTNSAYVEGWALYSERLGKDLGFYQDPYSDYGRLTDEMLRAIRLVVDTGVHYKHWTRQQMVDFFHEHSSVEEPDVQAETDRYIAWPGQALAYKLGQLEILKLRTLAEKELGPQYDIRSFHDEILNGGSLPIDVMDARVTAWIRAQKSGAANGTH